VLACPLTFNSVNKFAHGHADNFAVGLLCEMAATGAGGRGPHCKPQLASHPAFTASLETLRGMGAYVLFDPDAPYESRLPSWAEVTAALRPPPRRGDAVSGDENAPGARIARARRRRGLSQSVTRGPGRPVGVLAISG